MRDSLGLVTLGALALVVATLVTEGVMVVVVIVVAAILSRAGNAKLSRNRVKSRADLENFEKRTLN